MNNELIEKLRALLSKTPENGCTAAEAEAAMEAAQRIAARNNIDLASVRVEHGEPAKMDITKAELNSKSTTRRPHHEAIAHVLQSCFDVKLLWLGNTPRAVIMGEATDVAIASYCWGWLEGMMQRLYREYLMELPMHIPRDNILARSYYLGFARGVIVKNTRVKKEAEQRGGQSYALVLVDKKTQIDAFMKKEFPVVKNQRQARRQYNHDAYVSGVNDGGKIKLAHALA